jgi:predicted Zn-ribbon and HTH transcriptional regulator
MTIRKEIIELLSAGEWTAGEISRAVHIPQKEVYIHMAHIMRSLRGDLRVVPAECLACGFKFSKRKAIQSPSRCPLCKSEHIKDPAYFCYKNGSVKKKRINQDSPVHQQ